MQVKAGDNYTKESVQRRGDQHLCVVTHTDGTVLYCVGEWDGYVEWFNVHWKAQAYFNQDTWKYY